ncbi:hypothetical protein ACOME3_008912 [Neoechinorhynchus agilis]
MNKLLIKSLEAKSCENNLCHYLSLDVSVDCEKCVQYGVRVLSTDPVECVFTFICSANNNAKRIRRMVNTLCSEYGDGCITFPGDLQSFKLHNFPEIELNLLTTLLAIYTTEAVEKRTLRDWCLNKQCPPDRKFLEEVSEMNHEDARRQLLKIPGVGLKVADCILLMSMRKWHVVPIDTHMRKYAEDTFKSLKVPRSLTNKSYDIISAHYRKIWGEYAGWIQAAKFVQAFDHGRLRIQHN